MGSPSSERLHVSLGEGGLVKDTPRFPEVVCASPCGHSVSCGRSGWAGQECAWDTLTQVATPHVMSLGRKGSLPRQVSGQMPAEAAYKSGLHLLSPDCSE